jgi:hypothetical protein
MEYSRRPLLSIRPPEASEKLRAVCEKWFPKIMARVKSHARVPQFTLDKRSKLGSPVRKRVDNKLEVCTPFFEAFLADDWSSIEQDGAALQGIRLQWERRSKTRTYVCSTRGLQAEVDVVDAEKRLGREGRLCSRTRMVVNPAILNLAKQPGDNSVHHVLLSWPCCKPDLEYMRTTGFDAEELVAPDWTHFDHQAGYMAPLYASTIGGNYEEACKLLWSNPVLCRVDGWRDVCYLRAAEGYLMQFWSGDSSVAPFGKFVCLSTMCDFLQTYFNLDDEQTLDAMCAGQYGTFGFRNYGDDNIVFGPSEVIKAYVKYAKSYIDMDLEDPPRFLGDVFRRDPDGRWRSSLDWRSYFLNWHLAERAPGTVFRPKPCVGWLSRRKDYTSFGPKNMHQFLDVEDVALKEHRFDIEALILQAKKEMEERDTSSIPYRLRYDKSYLLTEEQKATLPEYNVVPREMCRRLAEYFLTGWRLNE